MVCTNDKHIPTPKSMILIFIFEDAEIELFMSGCDIRPDFSD
jgi:hypothetical protein